MSVQESQPGGDVLQKLKELSLGLFYMSESDYPLEVVSFDQVPAQELSPTEVRSLTGQPQNVNVEVVALNYFFRNQTKENAEADEKIKETAQRFRELQAYLEQHLQDVKVYRIGKREIKAYILGKLPAGQYAGLKTTVIET